MIKPQVVIINSASLDGKLAISPDHPLLYGDERWQAIEEWSAAEGETNAYGQLKAIHKPQATLEGSGSFVTDDVDPEPLPPVEGDPASLYEDFMPESVVHREEHRGWFTAIDGRGRVRNWIKDGAAFGEEHVGWHLLVLVGHHTPATYLAYLQRESIPYLVAGDGPVDLRLGLKKMQEKLGVTCILSTAGGRLNGALLRAGLVDEINVELLPALIGGPETPSLFNSPPLKSDEWPTRLKLISVQEQTGGRVWLRYHVISKEGEV